MDKGKIMNDTVKYIQKKPKFRIVIYLYDNYGRSMKITVKKFQGRIFFLQFVRKFIKLFLQYFPHKKEAFKRVITFVKDAKTITYYKQIELEYQNIIKKHQAKKDTHITMI